jgi:hypothetical protein
LTFGQAWSSSCSHPYKTRHFKGLISLFCSWVLSPIFYYYCSLFWWDPKIYILFILGKTVVSQNLCVKLGFFGFFWMSFCLLYLKQLLLLFTKASLETFFFFFTFVLLYYTPLSRGNSDFCQEKWHCVKGSPDSQSGSLSRCQRGGLSRGPWYQEGISGVCDFVSITICSLIVSNLEETNLTNRLRDQGLSRGRNQVSDGSQD